MFRYILFDLDGTLTDPGIGITNSVAHALRYFGIEVRDRTELYPFIGPPLRDSFMQRFGFTYAQSDEAIARFREYFRQKGIFENTVYDGVEAMLRGLRAAGKTLLVATSKPQVFAEQILRHFGLYDYFDVVAGAEMDETRTRKADVIAYALEKCPGADRSACVMVGDREYDIAGAAANGLAAIGVTFGYGSREELAGAGAWALADSPAQVLSLCIRK